MAATLKLLNSLNRNHKNGVNNAILSHLSHFNTLISSFTFFSTYPLPTPELLPSFYLPNFPSLPFLAPLTLPLETFFISHAYHTSPAELFLEWRSLPLQPEANIPVSTITAQHGKVLSALLPREGRYFLPNGNSKPNFTEKHFYTWSVCSIFLLIPLIFRYILELTLELNYQESFFFLQGNVEFANSTKSLL